MEDLFETLDEGELDREKLYLAWDFTVASEKNRSERILTCATPPSPNWATRTSPT